MHTIQKINIKKTLITACKQTVHECLAIGKYKFFFK